MALGDADLGLSPPTCASVCAGQLLRCTISPALHKGIWLSGPRAYLPCGLLFGSSHRSGAPDATNKQVFASWVQNGTALHQVAQTAASTDFLPRFLPKRQPSGVDVSYVLVAGATWAGRPEHATSLSW
jgi:hypothetical protein